MKNITLYWYFGDRILQNTTIDKQSTYASESWILTNRDRRESV
jgi:hypothetical protein